MLLSAGLFGFAFATAPAAEAATEQCRGRNLLPELQKEHPALYQRITTQVRLIPNHEAALWKISRPGRPASHLLGTVHTSDPRIARLTPNVERALLEARVVATEIAVLSRMRMREYLKKNPERLFYTNGSTLESRLTPEEFTLANAALREFGFPASVTQMMRPWFAHYLLLPTPCEKLRALKGYSVLDQIIGDEARNNRIPVIGLEAIGEQIDAFAGLSPPRLSATDPQIVPNEPNRGQS